MSNIFADRIEALRKGLDKNDANWYLCTTSDPHGSEYISDHYKIREFLSGFTGSNGDLLIGPEGAWLWTDGRYFVQAAKELEGSGTVLMRMGMEGVPELNDFLKEHILEGDVLMFNGKLMGAATGAEIRDILKEKGAFLLAGADPADEVWKDRPADSSEKIWILPSALYGEEYEAKLCRIRKKMKETGCGTHIISALDDQMWLFNIRGGDIRYNPVCYAYTVISEKEVRLYVKEESVTDELISYAEDKGIVLLSYHDFYGDLNDVGAGRVLVDPAYTNYLLLRLLEKQGAVPVFERNPSAGFKAVKNRTECENIRRVYLKDSLILTRFLKYMKEEGLKAGISEYEAAMKLDKMRLEDDECYDLSFTTISACGANAAMMHYEAEKDNCAVTAEDEVYLVDSGGQYTGGTTDVTRTLIPVGASAELKKHFTKVCAGTLALQNVIFLKGVTGRNLDVIARKPLWELGTDYKCGTGHGVGYMLNVHEGPQSIRPKCLRNVKEAEMEAGVVISDEPGVYIEGKYGIRTENILLCVSSMKNADGEFLSFEPLTYVPIDLDGIDTAYLEDKERRQLNEYHRAVREKLSPFMNEEEKIWLENVTREV
ncbi:MAG: aminopeptidase P family N-terminal domain-containing protein [Lachnospiraceae bacterium]|nr:aminopeptidase P family N-terminal domain-containing protein [Lachnospiraceae bacterium]